MEEKLYSQNLERYKGYGLLLAFEGPDGAGKTTLIKALDKIFQDNGFETCYVRNPGCDEVTNKIRDITKQYSLNWFSYACLFAASLKHAMLTIVKPALEQREVVFIDRFIRSTYVYQMFYHKFENESDEDYAKRLDLFRIITEGCVRDIVRNYDFKEYVLNVDPKLAWERVHGRADNDAIDIWESQDFDYFKSINEAYRESISNNEFYGMCYPKVLVADWSTDQMIEEMMVTL